MNYTKHYNKLILRARNRNLQNYFERHHIIPKCMGGTNHKTNLVDLMPEEHYIAHQLLVKMYPNVCGLVSAAYAMGLTRINNKLYGWIKRKANKVMLDRQRAHLTPEQKHFAENIREMYNEYHIKRGMTFKAISLYFGFQSQYCLEAFGRLGLRSQPHIINKYKNDPAYAARIRATLGVGNKNPNYGKRWITDGSINIRITFSDSIPDGFRYGMTK